MDIETCHKYFVFLNAECDRHLRDGTVDEQEMASIKIEFDRFIKTIEGSDLPSWLKMKIAELELDFTYTSRRDSDLPFEAIALMRWRKARRERKYTDQIQALKHQIKGIPMFIQLNA